MDLFTYIPIVIAIRQDEFTPLVPSNSITAVNKIDVHKRVLAKLYDENYAAASIFENELFVTRPLNDINNNELKTFMLSNNDWDIIVVSNFDEVSSTLIPWISLVEKANTNEFPYEKVYIASSRMMLKAKQNDLSNIQVYKYTSPFFDVVKLPIRKIKNHEHKYTISKVQNINVLDTSEVKYTWSLYHV